jgi:putative aldouronate transport system substrate-binding protein
MKKTLVLVLCFAMLLTLAAGCTPAVTTTVATTKGPTTATTATPTTTLGPPVEIVYMFPSLSGVVPPDLQLVNDEINKISIAKINVKVKMQTIANANYAQQINLMITGNEKLDAFLTMPGGSTHITTTAANKQLTDLTELAPKVAQDMLDTIAAVSPAFINGAKVNGKLYGIPCLFDKVTNYYMMIRKDVLDKNNLDLTKAKNKTDVEAILKVLKEKETIPALTAQGADGNVLTVAAYDVNWDNFAAPTFTESFGSATWLYGKIVGEGSTKVINPFASDYHKMVLNMTRDWFQKGYINKDSATQTEQNTVVIANNGALGSLNAGEFDIQASLDQRIGKPMSIVKIVDGIVNTGIIQKFTWAVAITSKQPEAALKFIALTFTNADVLNLVNYGIPGKHYITDPDGRIKLPDGVTSKNNPYSPGGNFLFGNSYLAKVWSVPTNPPDMRAQILAVNKKAKSSPFMGFSVNNSTFTNELTAVTNAITQYNPGLWSGTSDPATELPKFLAALETAGYGKILTEVQKQVDAFVAKK